MWKHHRNLWIALLFWGGVFLVLFIVVLVFVMPIAPRQLPMVRFEGFVTNKVGVVQAKVELFNPGERTVGVSLCSKDINDVSVCEDDGDGGHYRFIKAGRMIYIYLDASTRTQKFGADAIFIPSRWESSVRNFIKMFGVRRRPPCEHFQIDIPACPAVGS